jgi:Zn-dependent protease
MGKDIPLGRIAGIRVGMDVSVFLVAAYYTVALATRAFPSWQPGQSPSAYWAAGVAGALLLFLSLLVHEIGHALVARDEGISVHSMGLTLLGGVTRMESSPTTAGAEFRVSVVGPIASATCGVVFLVGAYLFPDGGALGLAGRVFFWVGIVNLGLAALNMIPAAPLDGGKVLSAAIWRITGNQALAQTWSAGAGIVVGMAAITWGFREVRDPGSGTDLFAVSVLIIGAFIAYSAFQQLRAAPIYRALEGRTVADGMAADPPCAPGWATVGEFLRSASPQPEHQAYPVVGPDGQVEGLLTAAAIRSVSPMQWDRLPVRSLAYPLERITLVRSDDALLHALQRLEGADVAHAMVVSPEGRIVGTLDPAALHRALTVSEQGRPTAGVGSAGV